jgi:hypothetical protein
MMGEAIPKASTLFQGDINTAVAAVQKVVGITITPEWWSKHVGNSGTAQEILDRFDAAYKLEVMQRKASSDTV